MNKKNRSIQQYLELPWIVGMIMVTTPVLTFADEKKIEVITISAQKRPQSLDEVAIAVTAFTGDNLDSLGVEQPVDLAGQTPNLSVKNASGSTAPVFTIRGVGLNAFVSNVNPSVAVYVDEVYQVNTSMMSFGLFDLERVEVLKGPQGTLFGRNTTGGAVSFISIKPSENFEAYVKSGLGSYDTYTMEGAVGGALSETLNGRISFSSKNQNEGFFTNRVTGNKHGEVDQLAWRGQLAWQPTESFSALLNVHGGRDKSDQWMLVHRGLLDANGNLCAEGAGSSCYDANGYRDNDGDFFNGDYNLEPKIDNKGNGATLTLDWEFDTVTLTSVTNQESFEYFREEEFDASPNTLVHTNFSGDVSQFSQELRLLAEWDDFTLITGLFYSRDTLDEKDFYNLSNNPVFITNYDVDYEQETATRAAFFHSEWKFTQDWKLTAGFRITNEEVTFNGGTTDLFPETSGLGRFGLTGGILQTETIDATEPTGKVALDWTPIEDVLLYTSYSRGFKSGGFNGSFALSAEEVGPFDKETLDAYEIGFKSTLADHTVKINGAVYYYDYQNLQIFDTNIETSAFLIQNAGNAEISGFELEGRWLITSDLDISLGIGYSDTEIVEYSTNLGTKAEGNVLANTPKWTINSIASYYWELSEQLGLRASVDFNWQDDVFFSVANDPRAATEGYLLTNASLTLARNDDQWKVRGWVKNLANEGYFTEQFLGVPAGLSSGTVGSPRTFGIEFTYNWY
ncbi:MAG: TonB-dependent receptor [Colwellia sp.]|nr:TonB-dependent receptor [Colwellia sp.]